MKGIAVGSDHRGLELKRHIVEFLKQAGYKTVDCGAYSTESCDYPDQAFTVVEKMRSGECDGGVLICASGLGMSMAANRFRGIRAALCKDKETARLSRLHNDANILVLANNFADREKANDIVRVWLDTEFEGGRHQRRVEKIDRYANEDCRKKG